MAVVSTTVLDVIDTAIGMAQLDLSFRPLARGFYNRLLEKHARNFDFPYYRKVQADQNFIAGQLSYDLPDDYSRSDDCYLIGQGSQRGPEIRIVDPYYFDQLSVSNYSGTPRVAKIDLSNRKIVFDGVPSSGTSYQFRHAYFRLPEAIDTEGGDDSESPDFEQPELLIQDLTAWLMKYTDDERQPGQAQETQQGLRDMKLNAYDQDPDPKVQLASSAFRPGSRPTRGSGGFGWGDL